VEKEFSFKNYFIPFTTSKAVHWIVIIGLIVFCNGFFNGFVKDDHAEIIENPVVQSIQNFPNFFTGSLFYNGLGQQLAGSFYRPITSVVFSSIYSLFGASSFAFHFFPILFFIINACFVFYLFKQFFKTAIAFALSLVFLVHPINSEVALYISALQEVLFLFFGMITLLILHRYKSQKAFIISSICLLLSLLSKETGILFFFMSYVYLFLFARKGFYYFLGYSLVALCIYFFLRVSAIGIVSHVVANAPIQNLSLSARLLNIPAIILFYLKVFIFPLNLSSSYHFVYTRITTEHFWLPLIIDLIFFIAIIATAWSIPKRNSRRYFTVFVFFSIWLLVGLLLHMQILPLDKTVAEQWFYFPIVGILGMIGVVLEIVPVSFRNKWVIAITGIIIILLSVRTFVRSFDWRDDLSIATQDITVSRDAYDLESELSFAYFQQGNLNQALLHAKKSVELYPAVTNLDNLGSIYGYLGQYKEAENAYHRSLLYGSYYLTYENLAALSLSYGDKKKNIAFIKNAALKQYPYDAKLWLYLAGLEYNNGDKKDALFAIQHSYQYGPSAQAVSIYKAIVNNQRVSTGIVKSSNY
jgi:hypothetical protein